MKQLELLKRTGKAALASALVTVAVVAGGVTLYGASHSAPVYVATAIQTSNQVAAPAAAATTTSGTPQQSAQPSQSNQPIGVLDARTAVRAANPAVVTVISQIASTGRTGRGRSGSPQSQLMTASGSGVIIDKAGYIVTNAHVVEGAQSVQVVYYNSSTPVTATIVGADSNADIAVLKVSGSVPGVANFGDSDAVQVGQPVVAIGSALGDYTNSVTAGIVSGVHRSIGPDQTGGQVSASLQDLIQTDAAINHGDSGGPLLDLSGNVVGIDTAVVRTDSMQGDVAEGLGFAIPSNTAKQVVERLISQGR